MAASTNFDAAILLQIKLVEDMRGLIRKNHKFRKLGHQIMSQKYIVQAELQREAELREAELREAELREAWRAELVEAWRAELREADQELEALIQLLHRGLKLINDCYKIKKWRVDKVFKYKKYLLQFKICVEEQIQVLRERRLKHGTFMAVTQNQHRETLDALLHRLPELTVGLNGPLEELKLKLLKDDDVSTLVVIGPGGCGKTTLATMFFQDEQVKDKFKNNSIFITISRKPSLKLIVKELYKQIGYGKPILENEASPVKWLQMVKVYKGEDPLLVVLDDVWSGSESILEMFLFNMSNYKILVTSRSELNILESSYHLPLLNLDNAMELFHHTASLGDKSSHIPKELSVEIVNHCNGNPLAITIAGSSLCGQPKVTWQSRLIEWQKGSSMIDSETRLLLILQSSIDALDEGKSLVKECFLDFGAFPEDATIQVSCLIGMWTVLYEDLDEEALCYATLRELDDRSLANYSHKSGKDTPEVDRHCSEYIVRQHDLLRELAIYCSKREEPVEDRERMFIEITGNHIPKWLRVLEYETSKARLVSISTDEEFLYQWPNMHLPEAKVLVLNSQERHTYVLPKFVEKMDKLKMLVCVSYGHHIPIKNLQVLSSSSHLTSLRLDGFELSFLTKSSEQLNSLRNLYLRDCQSLDNVPGKLSYTFPILKEIVIDTCGGSTELPVELCELVHLTKLEIIFCTELLVLPEAVGDLVNLQVLRVRDCIRLSKLPDSIRNLRKLKSLDMCGCRNLKVLPEHIGELTSLTKLRIDGCTRLSSVPDGPRKSMNLEELQIKQKGKMKSQETDEEKLTMMNQQTEEKLKMKNQFSSGLEWANLLATSDPIHQAWNAIEQNAEPSLYHTSQNSDASIFAFGNPFSYFDGKDSLISSSTLKEEKFPHLEFLCNKSNPVFSINATAISDFRLHYEKLEFLKNELVVQMSNRASSIIITGRHVGGCVAILFTLWLLHSLNLSKTKPPLCITFGSPLLGDECLRQCVLQKPAWNSCFLHVASAQDPIPKLFLSQNPTATYKPFGTFLICSASGCACFEEPESILEWLMLTNTQSSQKQSPDLAKWIFDYGQILEDLRCKALCRDEFKYARVETDPLQVCIMAEMQAVGFPPTQEEPIREINSVTKRTERHRKLLSQRKNVLNSSEILKEMKIIMAKLECYKKEAIRNKFGYYDMYKRELNTSDVNVNECKMKLMNYWQDYVAEEEYKPHHDGDFTWIKWLMAGTSYRKMIEPLHIAEYYMKDGAKNYITDIRPRHFILLEQWWKEMKKPESSANNAWIRRQVAAARLNEDSCFWAHVEEAIRSCNMLNNKDSNPTDKEGARQKLKDFEDYMYDAIKKNELSLDVFLEGSSFRQWWKKYEAIKGSSYCSSLMIKLWQGKAA